MKVQFKLAIFIGIIALFTVGGIVAYQSVNQVKEEINLSNLIELPYEILLLKQSDQEESYDVYLVGELDYTNEILLSTKIQKEISNYYGDKNASINLHVYQDVIELSELENGVNITDSAYSYTIQTNGSNVFKYEPIKFQGIEGDVTSSSDWRIENSTLNKDKELIFTTHLKENLSNEAIFSTAKGISDEMRRHNFKDSKRAIIKQKIVIPDSEILYHDSNYPNYLIQESILVGNGHQSESVSEGVEE